METTQNGNFICSDQKIEIPAEYRKIAIRANDGKNSPFGTTAYPTEWPDKGSVRSQGERGLFGVLLWQDMREIKWLTRNFSKITYMILEVHAIDIKIPDRTTEIEFSKCNILYSGELPEFLERLKDYATKDEHEKICGVLEWKVSDVLESRKSPEKMQEFILKTEERRAMLTGKAKILISYGILTEKQLIQWR